MVPQKPEVAGHNDDILGGRRLGDRIGPGIACWAVETFDQEVDLAGLEARDLDVEVDLDLAQILELAGEQLRVPARVLGQLVVGQGERPFLGLAQMG